jgi:gliding motility-associated-like protein
MKKKILFAVLVLLSIYGRTQTIYDSLDRMKLSGKLTGTEHVTFNTIPISPVIDSNFRTKRSSSCDCWIQRDASWQIGQFNGSGGSGGPGVAPEYRNDDWTTPLISLPFNFCFYGTNYTDFYLNNNGNISFGAPYSTFTATGFPDPSYIMVAPFWGDVDTRDLGSGLVYYKITPTALLVQWDHVGYYGAHSDLVNTFQLIITNGSDPLIPGNNVSFCYKDMQWSTGDASGGTGGFGGFPATVGANKGDGTNFIQFGTFDQPGSAYDGPTGANEGIDWLDNQYLLFNTCGTSNISPIANGLAVCDTMIVCIGDTLDFDILFMSAEAGQTTTVTTTSTMSDYHVVSNTPANNVDFSAYAVAQAADTGFQTVNFVATDNGTPVAMTNISLTILVLPVPVADAGNDTSLCHGPVQLQATGGTVYSWSPATGLSNPNIANPIANPSVTTTYVVEVFNGSCTDYDTITVFTGPVITAGPDTTFCAGGHVQLASSGVGAVSYHWSPSAGLSNPNVSNPVASPGSTTTYVVNITDATGCNSYDSVTVTIIPPVSSSFFTITPDPDYYVNDILTFTDTSASADAWYWNSGDGDTSTAQNITHTYLLPGTYTICHTAVFTGQCYESQCRTIEILAEPIVIPNVVTPNGDGINDLLVFKNLEYYPGSALSIYNRWGTLLYESPDYGNNWNGKDYADGVYYYILRQNNIRQSVYHGFFHLFKK